MFLTKITLNNIRSFSNEVKIDLNHNLKNIKEELEKNELFIRKEKVVYTPIVSIGGSNAIGKTSLLETISIISHIFNILLFYRRFNSKISGLIQKNFYEQFVKIDNDFVNIIIKSIKNSIKNIFFGLKDFEEKDSCIKEFSNWFKKNEYKNISETSIKTFINEIFELKKEILQKIWNSLKSYSECSSFVKFEFYDENIGFFELVINDMYINGKVSEISLKIEFSKNKKNKHYGSSNFFKLLNKILEKLFEFGENVFIYGLVHEYQASTINAVFLNLDFLIKILGKEKTLRLIRICDDSIVDIGVNTTTNITDIYLKQNVVNLFTKNGVKNPTCLSQGTKKFLDIICLFLDISSKNSGLILIDELDNCMHNKLVDFFKIYVQHLSMKKDIQLIYSSHNPICLVSRISAKQIYLINKFEDEVSFEKFSTSINKNNSPLKILIEEKIGSHPSTSEILSLVMDIVFND